MSQFSKRYKLPPREATESSHSQELGGRRIQPFFKQNFVSTIDKFQVFNNCRLLHLITLRIVGCIDGMLVDLKAPDKKQY